MSGVPVRLRLSLAMALTLGGLVLHEIVQGRTRAAVILEAQLESLVPFVPWTIWGYLAFFPLIAWTALRVEPRRFWVFVFACVIAALAAWSIVLTFPISFVRPDAAAITSGRYREIFTFVHAADPSHISFPSLHVAVTWICCFTLWGLPWRAGRLLLCCAISLSTLTTKQHLLIDASAGIVLAWFSVDLSERLACRFDRMAKRA